MGFVGQGMLKYFPDAYQFDEPKGIGTKEEVNECDLAIICVPTPSRNNGRCDTDIVESVVQWVTTPLVLIKSTVEPGTTARLSVTYGKRIIFSPEYMGESSYYVPSQYLDPKNPVSHGFLILGGEEKACTEIADIFVPVIGPTTRIRIMQSVEAELIKYAENSFFAMKVMFSNELRDMCDLFGANWHRVREGWLDDPRIGPMHTAVFPDKRGFGGKCYPKDVKALYEICRMLDYEPLMLKATMESNNKYNV